MRETQDGAHANNYEHRQNGQIRPSTFHIFFLFIFVRAFQLWALKRRNSAPERPMLCSAAPKAYAGMICYAFSRRISALTAEYARPLGPKMGLASAYPQRPSNPMIVPIGKASIVTMAAIMPTTRPHDVFRMVPTIAAIRRISITDTVNNTAIEDSGLARAGGTRNTAATIANTQNTDNKTSRCHPTTIFLSWLGDMESSDCELFKNFLRQ